MAQKIVTIGAGGILTEISDASVSSVTGTAPVASSGGTTPAISMAKATAAVDGYLAAADFTTFNGKQASLGFTPINKAGDTGIGALSTSTLTAASANIYSGAALTSSTWGRFVGVEGTYPGLVWNSTAASGRKFSFGVDANQMLLRDETAGATRLTISDTGAMTFSSNVGFNGNAAIAKPTITGSRAGNAALASLLTALASYGLITDSTTA